MKSEINPTSFLNPIPNPIFDTTMQLNLMRIYSNPKSFMKTREGFGDFPRRGGAPSLSSFSPIQIGLLYGA
jgi:hypothetical protein